MLLLQAAISDCNALIPLATDDLYRTGYALGLRGYMRECLGDDEVSLDVEKDSLIHVGATCMPPPVLH